MCSEVACTEYLIFLLPATHALICGPEPKPINNENYIKLKMSTTLLLAYKFDGAPVKSTIQLVCLTMARNLLCVCVYFEGGMIRRILLLRINQYERVQFWVVSYNSMHMKRF